MLSQQLDRIRKQAYQEAYGYDASTEIPEGVNKFIELYDLKKAILEFEQTPAQWLPYPNDKKAKEIALDATLRAFALPGFKANAPDIEEGELLLTYYADKVYQWLIKKQSNG